MTKCLEAGCQGINVADAIDAFYPYPGCGLDNVMVQGGDGYRWATCSICHARSVQIRAISRLHQAIADEVACSEFPLSEGEHRFLLKFIGDGPLPDLIGSAMRMSLSNHVPWLASSLIRIFAVLGPDAMQLAWFLRKMDVDPEDLASLQSTVDLTGAEAGARLVRLLSILPRISIGTRSSADALIVATYANHAWRVERKPAGDATFIF